LRVGHTGAGASLRIAISPVPRLPTSAEAGAHLHLGEVGGPVWVEGSESMARDGAIDPGSGADVLPRLVDLHCL